MNTGKVNIYVSYDQSTEQMAILLPGTTLVADRKNGTLNISDEFSEGQSTEHSRSLGTVMFSDVVNMIANKIKGY